MSMSNRLLPHGDGCARLYCRHLDDIKKYPPTLRPWSFNQAALVMLAEFFILTYLISRNMLSPSPGREALILEHHNWFRVRAGSESAIAT